MFMKDPKGSKKGLQLALQGRHTSSSTRVLSDLIFCGLKVNTRKTEYRDSRKHEKSSLHKAIRKESLSGTSIFNPKGSPFLIQDSDCRSKGSSVIDVINFCLFVTPP